MKSKVSIIVPIYNTEKYLEGCLNSLLCQTLKEIEIICIDDGSTDNSLKVLRKCVKGDSRVRVVKQKNQGRSVARNVGLELAKSPFVMFCDSDDKFEANMCEEMVKLVAENDVDLVVCGINVKYEVHHELKDSDDRYYELKYCGKKIINDEVILKTDASVCNKIFRMDYVRKYEIKFPKKLNNEDYYFCNAYMSVAKTCYYAKNKLYEYVRHDGSIMSENFEKLGYSPDHLLVAEKLFVFYKNNNFLPGHSNLFWRQFDESFWFSYKHTSKEQQEKILLMARNFINEFFEKYMPANKKVRRRIEMIKNYNSFYRCREYVLNKMRSFYVVMENKFKNKEGIK